MSAVKNLSRIIFPNDLLIPLSHLYRHIGRGEAIKASFGSHFTQIVDQTIERDAYFLGKRLSLKLTDSRMRLIITKDSAPRSKDEIVLAKLKDLLRAIQLNHTKHLMNSSDCLAMLNHAYSHHNPVKFEPLNVSKRPQNTIQAKSKRVIFDEFIAEYVSLFEKERFERITLSIHFFVDLYNLKPFTEHNELASFLFLLSILLRSGIEVFSYVSLFELLESHAEEFTAELQSVSFNWAEGYAQTIPTMRFFFKLILEAYRKLDSITKDFSYDQKSRKSDTIEVTIYRLDDIFSKEDIRIYHPFVSESTINRSLTKLKEDGVIKPLGKGRSAKWIKTLKDDDYRHLFK